MTTTCPNPHCGDKSAHHWDTSTEHGIYCGVCGYEERHKHHKPERWRDATPRLQVMPGGKKSARTAKRKKRKAA